VCDALESRLSSDNLDVEDDVVALLQHLFDAESVGFDDDGRAFNVNTELFRMARAAQRRRRRGGSNRRKNTATGRGKRVAPD
jgi:hypothetical protein